MLKPYIKYAIYLLEKRDYSEKELFDKITTKYTENEAAEAVANCVEKGYVNDRKYSERIIEKYFARYGKRRVSEELYKRGIDRELSQELIENAYSIEDESEKIENLIFQKLKGTLPSDKKEYDKVFAFLARKGYSSDEINHAYSEYKEKYRNNN